MRILFVINSLSYGGAEKLINDLIPRLIDRGHYCELLILTDKNEKYLSSLLSKGVKITIIPPKVSGHIQRMRFIKNIIFEGHYDIVHGNLFPSFYYCSLLKKLNKKQFPKLVMTEHNTDNRRRHKKIFRPIEKWIYKSYDKTISISEKTQECLLDWLKINNNGKFVVIDNGVPLQIFYDAEPIDRHAINESIEDKDVLICMVGSFTEQKNHALAIDVLKELPESYKLILLGEGPLRKAMEEKTISLGIESRVIFLGFRKDVSSIIKACDIMLIPSKWEGFGLVAVEAMACGKPIVASNVPGLAEVISDGGILCDCNESKDFIKGILSLADLNLSSCLAHKGLIRAGDFDIEKMANGYEKIYCELAKTE